MIRCPFCDEKMTVGPCIDGGFSMGCICGFQGPERPSRKWARRMLVDWLIRRAVEPEQAADAAGELNGN